MKGEKKFFQQRRDRPTPVGFLGDHTADFSRFSSVGSCGMRYGAFAGPRVPPLIGQRPQDTRKKQDRRIIPVYLDGFFPTPLISGFERFIRCGSRKENYNESLRLCVYINLNIGIQF